jgi:hypothetical protein
MSVNKKIWYGDNFGKSVNEDVTGAPTTPPPAEGSFTFDRMDITFDSIIRTFDEL